MGSEQNSMVPYSNNLPNMPFWLGDVQTPRDSETSVQPDLQ
jgi:hypothetical protein